MSPLIQLSFFEQLRGELIDKRDMGVIKFGVVALVAGLAGCGSEKVDQCNTDSDCTSIVYPFCDVNGEYSPSGGESHVCTVTPANCPVERCGCSPGATTCDSNQETTCNTDGKTTTTSTCSLGCADSKDHCLGFQPTNGLGAAMAAAGAEPDVTFPASVKINTDTGIVLDGANVAVNVTSLVVSPGDIRVFIAKSFDLSNVTVTGQKPFAFVAPGTIAIDGVISANAVGGVGSPGSATTGECVGQFDQIGAGGGNATAGGAGNLQGAGIPPVNITAAGGALQTDFSLKGGCLGGGSGAGGGGGAVQFDSLAGITIGSAGFIDVGGGGAQANNFGGGSGGLVVLESSTVIIKGGVTANGGSGSACGVAGADGQRSTTAASGPSCTHGTYAGDGGTSVTPPGSGGGQGTGAGGGGGGAVGRLRVATIDGTYSLGTSSVISVVIATDTLTLK